MAVNPHPLGTVQVHPALLLGPQLSDLRVTSARAAEAFLLVLVVALGDCLQTRQHANNMRRLFPEMTLVTPQRPPAHSPPVFWNVLLNIFVQ